MVLGCFGYSRGALLDSLGDFGGPLDFSRRALLGLSLSLAKANAILTVAEGAPGDSLWPSWDPLGQPQEHRQSHVVSKGLGRKETSKPSNERREKRCALLVCLASQGFPRWPLLVLFVLLGNIFGPSRPIFGCSWSPLGLS